LTSKVTAGVDAEEIAYIYNLQNRLSQVVRTTPSDLDTDEQEDDAIVETTWYYYNDEGIRVGTEYKREEVTDIGQGGESRSTTDDTVASFLIDSYNHTGYAQVIEELSDDGSAITATTYTIGDDFLTFPLSHLLPWRLGDFAGEINIIDSLGRYMLLGNIIRTTSSDILNM